MRVQSAHDGLDFQVHFYFAVLVNNVHVVLLAVDNQILLEGKLDHYFLFFWKKVWYSIEKALLLLGYKGIADWLIFFHDKGSVADLCYEGIVLEVYFCFVAEDAYYFFDSILTVYRYWVVSDIGETSDWDFDDDWFGQAGLWFDVGEGVVNFAQFGLAPGNFFLWSFPGQQFWEDVGELLMRSDGSDLAILSLPPRSYIRALPLLPLQSLFLILFGRFDFRPFHAHFAIAVLLFFDLEVVPDGVR